MDYLLHFQLYSKLFNTVIFYDVQLMQLSALFYSFIDHISDHRHCVYYYCPSFIYKLILCHHFHFLSYSDCHSSSSIWTFEHLFSTKDRWIMRWLSVQTLSLLLIRADAAYTEEEEWSDEFDDDTDEATLGLIPFVIWITNHKFKSRTQGYRYFVQLQRTLFYLFNVIDFTSQRKLHLSKMWMRRHMQLRQRRTCMKTFTSTPTQWVQEVTVTEKCFVCKGASHHPPYFPLPRPYLLSALTI